MPTRPLTPIPTISSTLLHCTYERNNGETEKGSAQRVADNDNTLLCFLFCFRHNIFVRIARQIAQQRELCSWWGIHNRDTRPLSEWVGISISDRYYRLSKLSGVSCQSRGPFPCTTAT